MNLFERIKRYFNRNNPEVIVGEIAENYEDRKRSGVNDPIDKTVDDIIAELKKHPEIESALLAKISENSKIPDRVFEKTATRITRDDDISDRVVTNVINRDDTNISDQSINKIIEEGDVDTHERFSLIKNLGDDKLTREQIENELDLLYDECGRITDARLVTIINEVQNILGKDGIDQKMDDRIQEVVAKKMAENYYSDISKSTKINIFSRAVPTEDMIKDDMASKVEKEYKEIEDERGEKKGRFDKKYLTTLIAAEMGKEIGYNYAETHAYVIPNLEGKLSPEDEEELIKQIQVISKKELTGPEHTEIAAQIEGRAEEAKAMQEDIIEAIKSVPAGHLSEVGVILKDKTSVDTIKEIKSTGLLETLNKMPEEKRSKTIKTVNMALVERNKKEELSQKNEQQITEQQSGDDEQEI